MGLNIQLKLIYISLYINYSDSILDGDKYMHTIYIFYYYYFSQIKRILMSFNISNILEVMFVQHKRLLNK